jgi:hypothetical protein
MAEAIQGYTESNVVSLHQARIFHLIESTPENDSGTKYLIPTETERLELLSPQWIY